MSGLNITPVHRNLHTRVTFLYLEFEDVFVVLGIAVFANIFGRFLHRDIGGIPLNVILQYIVPVLAIPLLIAFKYGKPRRYLFDFWSGTRSRGSTAAWIGIHNRVSAT